MEFRIVGTLQVVRDGDAVQIAALKERAVLALLLLARGRPVSLDRLIETIWEGKPPATAHKSVHGYVSALRRVLGRDRLVTVGRGYALRVDPSEVDVDRLENLVAEANGQELRRRVETLTRALALVRGEPLQDFADAAWAREERRRLEEVILAAVEARIDARLELGEHRELAAELEGLVAAHPYREHLAAQLMLAFYRSGRQTEALAVYRSVRDRLAEELGLQPQEELRSLEKAILRHDPELEPRAPPATPVPEGDRVRATHRRIVAGVLAVAVGAMIGAVALVLPKRHEHESSELRGNALAVLANGVVAKSLPLAAAPTRTVPGFGSLWIASVDAGTVTRVDLATRTVRQTIRVGHGPDAVAVGGGDVWAANSLDGTVFRIDPTTDQVVQRIAVGAQPSALVASKDAIWVVDRGDDNIIELDSRSGRTRRVIAVGGAPSDAAVAAGALWVASEGDGTVTRVDPRSGQVVDTIRAGDAPALLAASHAAIWVADGLDATVSRIDPTTDTADVASVGGTPTALAATVDGAVVGTADNGAVLRVTGDLGLKPIVELGERPTWLASYAGDLWVGVSAGGRRHRGGTLRIATVGPLISSLDPALEDELTPLQLFGLTNDGLVTLDHVGGAAGTQLVPDLALSLPMPTAAGRTYTFRMRAGIRYSTGRLVRPDDVRATFERLFDLRSPGRSLYLEIKGARRCLRTRPCDLSRGIVADDRNETVEFRLVRPDPDFLYKLAESYAVVLPGTTPHRTLATPLPATGPYEISSYRPGHELLLVRNPQFRVWSDAGQPSGYPNRILWRLGLSRAPATRLVEEDKADLVQNVTDLPARMQAALTTHFSGRLHTNPVMGTAFYFLNVRVPPFTDLRVRRALNLALNRTRLVAAAGGPSLAQPTCQILPPDMPGYQPYCPYTLHAQRRTSWTAPDLTKARRLVAASGTIGQRVTVWDSPGPGSPTAGDTVVAALRELGYRASLRLLPDNQFLQYTDNSQHKTQVVSGGWGADYPSPGSFIAKLSCAGFIANSTRTFDNSELCDRHIDGQIAHAEQLQITDRQGAIAAWKHLDHELTDLAVWLPTTTSKQRDLTSSRIGDYQYNPFWGTLLDQLWVR